MEVMDPGACERVLYREGFGMLALTDGDVPYIVPMSFGYDGADCFVQMTTSGRKNAVISTNPRASLAVLSVDPETGVSESVLVEGTIGVADDEHVADGLAALAGNAEFGTDLSVWGEPVQEVDLDLYRLEVEQLSGHRFGPGEQYL